MQSVSIVCKPSVNPNDIHMQFCKFTPTVTYLSLATREPILKCKYNVLDQDFVELNPKVLRMRLLESETPPKSTPFLQGFCGYHLDSYYVYKLITDCFICSVVFTSRLLRMFCCVYLALASQGSRGRSSGRSWASVCR